ncbi:MAG: response regulator, partial [Thermodesulfobacteriota bacterium]
MSRKKHRILYVDDEPSHLWIFQKCFEKEYDILLAEDAEKGIDLFEFHPDIAVVLADQCMPGMSGVELMSRVFAINPY